MTTQHTHHEHGEFDANAVENSSVPADEIMNSSAASEAETSSDAASSSSEDLATSADKQEHVLSEALSDEPLFVETSTNIEIPVKVSENDEASAASETTLDTEVNAAVSTFADVAPVDISSAQQEELPKDAESKKKDLLPLDVPHTAEGAITQEQAAEIVSLSASSPEDNASTEVPEPVAEQADTTTPVHENHPTDVHEDIEFSYSVPAESPIAQPVQEELPEVTSSVTEAPATREAEQPQATSEEETTSPTITFPYVEGAALIDARAEEVRPFTEFIAEFRQAEASLQATLRDSQADAFTLLTSVAANLTSSENQETPELIESTETILSGNNDHVAHAEEQEIATVNVHPDAEIEENTAARSEEEVKPSARPVSPLLRPASRLRIPRHGLGRHEREEAPQPVAEEPETSVAKAEAQPEAEATAEPVAPRPARRYRFDRPAAGVNGATSNTTAAKTTGRHAQPPVQHKTEEKIEKLALQEVKTASEPTVTASATPVPEPQAQPASKKHITIAQEAENATPIPAVEHGRRRHTQKETPVASPVQEVAPVIEPSTPVVEQTDARKEDVAPEDLPPLEYSELQKASSRRRRRHRSGSSSTTTSHMQQNTASIPEPPIVTPGPIVPPAPIPTPAPMPAQSSRLPAAAASEQANLYNIVSGYTVSQMNQGNEVTGPFMGPEPSPARGSIMSRDGRNTRAEARTTPPPALYSGPRSAEGGISTAAMTQFANIVGQALQTQTDRMVTEFRRVNQAPTSVSVSLPPFPSTERVGVFVDVANLLYSARTLRMGVDFGKLLDFLRGNRRLVRAHAYCPTSPQAGDEQMFLQAVKGLGYRITTKNYKTFSSGAKKADLDLDLCMDVVRLVDGGSVDCVVLVSGDSDFMPMLDYCSDHGVRVEVAAFDEAMSATLRQSCDLFINLSMLEEIRA